MWARISVGIYIYIYIIIYVVIVRSRLGMQLPVKVNARALTSGRLALGQGAGVPYGDTGADSAVGPPALHVVATSRSSDAKTPVCPNHESQTPMNEIDVSLGLESESREERVILMHACSCLP